jgi:exopolysaccharide production protein ExoZ
MVATALVAPSLFKTLIVAPGTLLLSLFFIPHFSASFPGIAWPLLVPGWTLNYEMFFYAVFAVCLALPAVMRTGALVGTMVVLVLAGYVIGPFASAAGMTYTNPLLLEFAAGVVVGRLFCAGRMRIPFSASVAAVILGFALLITRDSALLHFYGQLVGAVLVVAGSLHPRFSEYVNRPLQALGDASYSIYLTHIFTLGVLRVVWSRAFTGETTLASAIGFMVAALIVAAVVGWLCFHWVETPLLNRLTRLKRAKKAALASA